MLLLLMLAPWGISELRTAPVSHYRIVPQKSLPCRQFTGKNPS